MIRRLYVHNFRCLENFELKLDGMPSVLLIGKNGSGKTAVVLALEILQRIARGTNRVGDLVKSKDVTRGRTGVPMRFEIEVELDNRVYEYAIAFELPDGFKEMRVLEERLAVGGSPVYVREVAQVNLIRMGRKPPRSLNELATAAMQEAKFLIDWHLVALPIIQQESVNDPVFVFKQWLARVLLLRPLPALIRGDSQEETLQPNPAVADFGAWFSGVLANTPSAYTRIDEHLKQVMPDFKGIQNPEVGKDSRNLVVQFSNDQGSLKLPFADLSDGEKCFMICALVLAANEAYGPLLCFWDEPDNYLALDEVQQFVVALRRAFEIGGGQLIATSHNQETIRAFSDENTLLLHRRNHLEPTQVRKLSELEVQGDVVDAMTRGDLDPYERQSG